MALQFVLGVATASVASFAVIHNTRDRQDLRNLYVEKQLDKKVVELKYQNVSLIGLFINGSFVLY